MIPLLLSLLSLSGNCGTLWGFSPTVVEDVLYVAKETKVNPHIIASLVKSGCEGRRTCVRYCAHWEGNACTKQKEYYGKASRVSTFVDGEETPTIWERRLDSGLFDIHDAPLPASSWIREYNKYSGKPHITPLCALDRKCGRKLMTWIIPRLRVICHRKCRSGIQNTDNYWLSCWNGCASADRHVHRAAIWKKKERR